jgi:hypothetical protein
MALTAELQLSTGEILVIDENEIKAINKWLDVDAEERNEITFTDRFPRPKEFQEMTP